MFILSIWLLVTKEQEKILGLFSYLTTHTDM